MKSIKRKILIPILTICLGFGSLTPRTVRADLWGGDVVVLTQILLNALQQLIQLKKILTTGSDTLGLLRDINRGIKDGLNTIRIIHPKFNPGLFGNMETADRVLDAITDLYGRIPQTAEMRLQEAQDRSASEGIAMNGTLFRFADQADEESKRIMSHAQWVNPQGAAKLTAQSVAILIGVSTQVLRTNSMMLKMMSENMALQNRRDKLESSQFRTQYDGLSSAFQKLPKDTNLKPLQGGN